MALDPKKWTTKTQEAVAEAGDLARSLTNPQLTADHLLFAIASQEGTVAAALLSKLGQKSMLWACRRVG